MRRREIEPVDINQLFYFIEVCSVGNITKAAEKLHISQQGLSAAIRRLELELGCDLFYRKSSTIILTENGKTVLTEANAIASHINRMKECCLSKESGKYRIRIAVTESLIVRFPTSLQRLLINGTDDYEVHMIEQYSRDCCDLVSENSCSMGIIYGCPDENKFNVIPLDLVKQVIIVNRLHPLANLDTISIEELDNIPMVCTHKGTYPYNYLLDLFEKNHIRLNVAYECDRPRQTIDIISNNPLLAARTIEEEISEKDLEKIKVLHLADDELLLPVKLITRKGRELNMFERQFKKMILDCYKKDRSLALRSLA